MSNYVEQENIFLKKFNVTFQTLTFKPDFIAFSILCWKLIKFQSNSNHLIKSEMIIGRLKWLNLINSTMCRIKVRIWSCLEQQ